MNRLEFSAGSAFADLPLEHFNSLKFSVYILDYEWNYLFVNDFVKQNLDKTSEEFIGKNMWDLFAELSADPSFMQLKNNTEKGLVSNFITISPLTSQRLNIMGYPLVDCFFFTSSILPKKEDLINELREALLKNNIGSKKNYFVPILIS